MPVLGLKEQGAQKPVAQSYWLSELEGSITDQFTDKLEVAKG